MSKAVVIKNISNMFTLSDNGEVIEAIAQGKLKADKVLVGDKVIYEKSGKRAVITKLEPRHNVLVRPSIANIDNLIIVLAPAPIPDLILIDKLILTCLYNDIKPILCVNKDDLSSSFAQEIKKAYGEVVIDIVNVSAKEYTGIDNLVALLDGKISAFAGQSAVGKSTLLNCLLKYDCVKTGELSSKTGRGKHTTRHTEMFEIMPNTYVIDTPGFSMLNVSGITYDNLKLYYPDFAEFECKYNSCTHTKEDISECGIKQAVCDGKLDKGRYERYNILYNELKERKKVYEKN